MESIMKECIRQANQAVDRLAPYVQQMERRFGKVPALSALVVVCRILLAELPIRERVQVEELAERIGP
jgi:hypothetical protein